MIEGDLRDEVLDALGRLTRVDPEPFVSRPIALPTREHFPEPWAPTRAAQETLAQRLLSYVGLGEYVADVTIADGAIDPTALLPVTKVDFAGVEGKTIYFSVHTLGRTEDAAFAFAHEVARAALFLRRGGDASATYRDDARDRLAAPSDEDDDFDASVLAAHLGLGVLVAAGAFEFRTLGYMDGRRTFQTAVARVEHGGLPPEAASFLVAVQLCVRAIQGAERAAILKTLPTERADEVREVLPSLDREALLRRLGLPPPSEWRASALPAPTAVRLPERAKKKEKEPEARTAYRLLRSQAALFALLAVGAASVSTCFLAPLQLGWLSPVLLVAGSVGAALYGSARPRADCTACGKTITRTAARCRSCGALLLGDVASRSEALAADEARQRAARKTARTTRRRSAARKSESP